MSIYRVEDVIPVNKSNIKYIFILESPHIKEVATGVPLSGATGKNILRKLGCENNGSDTFGQFASKRQDTVIANISLEPLQALKADKRPMDMLAALQFIRSNYKYILRHRNDTINQKEQALIDCLKTRLDNIVDSICNNDYKIIVCGRLAEAFFKKVQPELSYQYMPHPSRYGWNKLDNRQTELLSELKRYYGQTSADAPGLAEGIIAM